MTDRELLVSLKAQIDTHLQGAEPPPPPPPPPPPDEEPPPPPLPDPTVWPPAMPPDPTDAEKALIRLGRGYPEPRIYRTAQWHDSEIGEVDAMRHLHCETATPEVVRSGILRLDVFVKLFHFQGGTFLGIRKVPARVNVPTIQTWMPTYTDPATGEPLAPGRRRERIPEGPAGHLVEFWTPVYHDLRTVSVFDFYKFEIDVSVQRPDGRLATARLWWKMWIDNSGQQTQPSHRTRVMHGEGWVSASETDPAQFGYLIVDAWGHREYLSDPAGTISIVPNANAAAAAGRVVNLRVLKNPDLHVHPPNYGQILHDWTFTAGDEAFKKLSIPQPPMAVGDRLTLRIVDAQDPDIGAGATLASVTLCEG